MRKKTPEELPGLKGGNLIKDDISVRAVNGDGGGGPFVPRGIFADIAPLSLCAPKVDARKVLAIIKDKTTEARYRIRDRNACKPGARAESRAANARYATVCGNYTVFTSDDQDLACSIDQAISLAVIPGVAALYGDAFKACTIQNSFRVNDFCGSMNAKRGNCGGFCFY